MPEFGLVFAFSISSALVGALITFLNLKGTRKQLGSKLAFPKDHPRLGESLILSGEPILDATSDYETTLFTVKNLTSSSVHQSVAAASRKGSAHLDNGMPRQDHYKAFTTSSHIVVAVSDGVSSSPESHVGSRFLTQNFEKVYLSEFADGFSLDSEKWSRINQKLSQLLVTMFVNLEKKAGRTVSDVVAELRLAAAAKFAATLEVLICERSDASGSGAFHFVSLAGDGSLFYMSNGIISKVATAKTHAVKDSNSVAALPVYDGKPKVSSGQFTGNSILLITTDGVGDFLSLNEEWKQAFYDFSSSLPWSEVELLGLIAHPDLIARDDRTIGVIKSHG